MRRLVAGVGVILAALAVPACGGRPETNFASGGPVSPGPTYTDPDIETFPNEGQTHYPVGTPIAYQTDPPTSGDHWPDPQEGGFYTQPIASEYLVHSLEHGAVEVYYYEPALTGGQRKRLQDLARAHPGLFSQFIAVPRNDGTYPIICVAWQHRLRLTSFDSARIDGFIALFLGNGPEHAPMPGQTHDD